MSSQRKRQKDRRKKNAKALRRALQSEADASKAETVENITNGVESLSLSNSSTPLRAKLLQRHGSVKPNDFLRNRLYLSRKDMVSHGISAKVLVKILLERSGEVKEEFGIPCALESLREGEAMLSKSMLTHVDVNVTRSIVVENVDVTKVGVAVKVRVRVLNRKYIRIANGEYVSQYVKHALLDHIVGEGMVFRLPLNGRLTDFKLAVTTANETVCIGHMMQQSEVVFHTETNTVEEGEGGRNMKKTRPPLIKLSGVERQLKQVCEVFESAMEPGEMQRKSGVSPPRGVLLYGPPGTGKTLIAQHVSHMFDAELLSVDGGEVSSRLVGESEARVRKVFDKAMSFPAAIIFIDEIDALCPSRETQDSGVVNKRVVSLILSKLDELNQSAGIGRVCVLAATNRPNSIDSALRRPGRFDREIEIGVPDEEARYQILKSHLDALETSIHEATIRETSKKLHGFVGADIRGLCRQASWTALQRYCVEGIGQLEVTEEDLFKALGSVKPSALREVSIEVPQVKWEDIGGNEGLKQQLKEMVEWPLQNPEAFKRMGIKPPQGVLLYGPPGCSKTLMAKAIATESHMNFIAVKGPELFSKYVGESEKSLQEVFRKARMAQPTIVFFDEIDAIAQTRGADEGTGGVSDRVLSQLLTEMDGIHSRQRVVVIGATNRPDILDPALLRPGRLDRVLYVPPPDLEARQEILGISLRGIPQDESVDISGLAHRTEGFSGAEVAALAREASLYALEESLESKHLSQRHLEKAFQQTTPQITQEMLRFYKAQFQRGHTPSLA